MDTEKKLTLRKSGDREGGLGGEILENFDRLIFRAREENSVLQTLISKLDLPVVSAGKNQKTEHMNFVTQPGVGVIDLPGITSWKSNRKKVDVDHKSVKVSQSIEQLIVEESGEEALQFIQNYTSLHDGSTHTISTRSRFNIDKIQAGKFENIVNLKRINDIRRINKFFESVNAKIPVGGVYIDNVETYVTRKNRILKKSFSPLNWIHYTIDVIVTRVFPKLPITKNIYFFLSRGQNRVLSKAETLGRLYSCGFEIVAENLIGDRLYFVSRKVKEPVLDQKPTYGPIIRLKRYGKGGKLFNVYKLRTMHAYSEYLQEYIYKQNDLQNGGKFKNDFRITTEGKLFRKFWLDEIPMFINLIKGNMKLVGVRPLSTHYFNLYSEELKQKRVENKPGLIPPFYADLPETLEEIMDSELRYLEAYDKNPVTTDIKYFFKAWQNILFRKARSN